MSSAKEFGEYVGECIVRAESAKTDLERDLFLKEGQGMVGGRAYRQRRCARLNRLD